MEWYYLSSKIVSGENLRTGLLIDEMQHYLNRNEQPKIHNEVDLQRREAIIYK